MYNQGFDITKLEGMPSKEDLMSRSVSEEEKKSEDASNNQLMVYLDPEDYRDDYYKAKMLREKERLGEKGEEEEQKA